MHSNDEEQTATERQSTRESSEAPVEPVGPSRADRLIELRKKTGVGPGQFRLSSFFWVVLALALLFAAPRMFGMHPGNFFLALYIACYSFAPVVAWTAVTLCPLIPRGKRMLAGVILFLLIAVSMPVWLLRMDDRSEAEMLLCCSIGFWLLQITGLAVIYGLLRPDRKRGPVKFHAPPGDKIPPGDEVDD